MLNKLIQSAKSWFNKQSNYSELEQFIISHNPQNTAHVEVLEREYDALKSKQNFVWGRGL